MHRGKLLFEAGDYGVTYEWITPMLVSYLLRFSLRGCNWEGRNNSQLLEGAYLKLRMIPEYLMVDGTLGLYTLFTASDR
jgi:hypothetical protein